MYCETHCSYIFIPETHTNVFESDNGIVRKMPYPIPLLVSLESGINSVSSACSVVETELIDTAALFLVTI
jgi:hypothetical protein